MGFNSTDVYLDSGQLNRLLDRLDSIDTTAKFTGNRLIGQLDAIDTKLGYIDNRLAAMREDQKGQAAPTATAPSIDLGSIESDLNAIRKAITPPSWTTGKQVGEILADISSRTTSSYGRDLYEQGQAQAYRDYALLAILLMLCMLVARLTRAVSQRLAAETKRA